MVFGIGEDKNKTEIKHVGFFIGILNLKNTEFLIQTLKIGL